MDTPLLSDMCLDPLVSSRYCLLDHVIHQPSFQGEGIMEQGLEETLNDLGLEKYTSLLTNAGYNDWEIVAESMCSSSSLPLS
jgi:hypothetical protein